jgi:hypothetical protein
MTNQARQSKLFLTGPNQKKPKKLLLLPKFNLSQVMQIITGHCHLRRQNAIVLTGINPPPLGIDISFRLCGLADEIVI